MSYDSTPAGSTPARRLRAVNASLSSIEAGMRPIGHVEYSDETIHLVFRSGQHRRHVGKGHSRVEREFRRTWRNHRKAIIKDRRHLSLA